MGTVLKFILILRVVWMCGLAESVAYHAETGIQRHIIYFAPKTLGYSKTSQVNGCQEKPVENFHLLGVAKACPAKKPIKLTKALKMGKQLCAKDWQVCSATDKGIEKLSWKPTKMPKGCFAINYGKNKAAGYGNHCHINHYFDGVLCCPIPGTKAAHKLILSPSYIHGKLADHRLNLVK